MIQDVKLKKQPNILITGVSGYIGRKLLYQIEYMNLVGIKFSSKYDFGNQNVITADLTDRNQVNDIFNKYKPGVVYHFAALTSPVVNEEKIEIARLSHLGITQNILDNISSDAHIIFLSTDKVFDGTNPCPDEEAPTNPLWVYGKFKKLCEDMIKERIHKYHVLRLPIVHSLGDSDSGSFIDQALIRLKEQKSVKAFDNVFRCYVLLSDLMNLLEKLMYDDHYGVYHVGTKMMSYYDRLKLLCVKNNIDYKNLLQPVKGQAKPMKQNLNTQKIKLILNFYFR